MSRQPTDRKVRMDEFKKQVAEKVLPPDGTVAVEIGKDTTVHLFLPLFLTGQDMEDFQIKTREATAGLERAKMIFSADRGKTPEKQWEEWVKAGYNDEDLALLFGAELQAARERLGEFRYSNS